MSRVAGFCVVFSVKHVLFQDIGSCRSAALASHHFLLVSRLILQPACSSVAHGNRIDRDRLKDKQVAESFNTMFERCLDSSHSLRTCVSTDVDVDAVSSAVTEAFTEASKLLASSVAVHAKRPWISQATLRLIEQRQQARIKKS